MRVVVFGHDAGHSNLVRRIETLQALGHDVHGLTMRRGDDAPRTFPNTDLGRTYDQKYLHRGRSIFKAAKQAAFSGQLDGVDLIWARNLDMLITAVKARKAVRSTAPIVYETLDIHRSLTGPGVHHMAMRAVERQMLRDVAAIVISSPAYAREYYNRLHPNHPPAALIENRLADDTAPPRPAQNVEVSAPLTLGWVGVLRCARSLALLQSVARHFEGRVQVRAHGQPAMSRIPDFHERVHATPHFVYHGPYRNPDDLPAVYDGMDVVWAGDYFQADANSRWALTNRLYEGGHFRVPSLVGADTEQARWVENHGAGIAVAEPLESHIIPAIERLLDPAELRALKVEHSRVPATIFCQGHQETAQAIEMAMRS